MRVVVIGGTGLVGSKLVHALTGRGHDAVAAAPSTGVNAVTGEGLSDVLTDASVVVDVSNSPSFEDAAATEFFNESTTNLLAAEAEAGVGHHVALSVVGTDRLAQESGYFQAKLARRGASAQGRFPTPSCARRSSSSSSVSSQTPRPTATLPSARIQPMASADVAEAAAIAAVGDPVNAITEVGGPEAFWLPELIRAALTARGDNREVVADPTAR